MRIKFSLFIILSIFTINTGFAADWLDFHFGVGYGGTPIKEKALFSTKTRKMTTGYMGTLDAFAGIGYRFFNLEFMSLSAGLEYQFNLPLRLV